MKMLLLYSPFAIIEEWMISFLLLFDSKIYGLFADLYSLYLELAMAKIFNVESFKNVIQNVYLVFGVVALFILAFSLLQAMVNPDDAAKGTNTVKGIVSRLLIGVGLTIMTPFMFDFLYDFQYSLLSNQVIPKLLIGTNYAEKIDNISYVDSNGNSGTISSSELENTDVTKASMEVLGNTLAYYVLSGFLHSNDVDGDGKLDDVIVDASEFWNTQSGVLAGGIGCIVGVAVTGVLALTGVGAAAAVSTGAGTIAVCTGGVVAGFVFNGVMETITAEEFSWNFVSTHFIQQLGNFDFIPAFSSAVVSGDMSYTPIISTIAGIVLLWMMFSFCLDLGVRAAKLVFYQVMAPISFLLSISPKNKDLIGKWFKAVGATYLEVFIRLVCVCGASLLVSNIQFINLSEFGLIARAIIVMGIVAFAKQVPKLFSEITGIKSGNMKLGIKNKLKEGGLFTAGHIATSGLSFGATLGMTGNPLAAFRAGRAGWKSGNFKAVGGEVRRNREYYKALKAGATKRTMALNAIRDVFGFDSTADAAERNIKEGKTEVVNNSASSIEYVSGTTGKVVRISSGGTLKIGEIEVENLKAKEAENIGKMAENNDKIASIEKKAKYAETQMGWKSSLDDVAKKDFHNGKFDHSIRYVDSSGVLHEEKVNGKRLAELSQQGMKFLYADENRDTYTVTYVDKDGVNHVKEKASLAELESLKNTYGDEIVTGKIDFVTEKGIEDDVCKSFVTQELSSRNPNLIKRKTEEFFLTLEREGDFNFKSFVYDDSGNKKIRDGKAVLETGKLSSRIEGDNRFIKYELTDENGNTSTIDYKVVGNGLLEYTAADGSIKHMYTYDLSDIFDKKGKGTQGVLNDDIIQIKLDPEYIKMRDENEAIKAVLKTHDEIIGEALHDVKQRGRDAAKKHRANHHKR